MGKLVNYIKDNTAVSDTGIDLVFFYCRCEPTATKAELLAVIAEHKGAFCKVDFNDRHEHGYIELGAWIGDQGLALRFMALGTSVGMFDLLTPLTYEPALPRLQALKMAGAGLVAVKIK